MAHFEEQPVGVLIALEPDEMAGLQYHVWFPYARDHMRVVREGALVAVRNFVSAPGAPAYSILELVQVLPIHYALGSSAREAERAFPGFVTEAARSARQDWEQETPTEETTQIRTVAIPTGVELRFASKETVLATDESLPMQGEDVHLLLPALVNSIMNRGLLEKEVPAIQVGTLVQTPEVPILVKMSEMLRTHFGVFGFTGAGKSNLLSTLVAKLMTSPGGPRIILFDLMGEYVPLLADVLHNLKHGYLLSLDRESVPGGEQTLQYLLKTKGSSAAHAAEASARTMLLPGELTSAREKLARCLKDLFEAGKIRIWDPGDQLPSGEEALDELLDMIPGNAGKAAGPMRRWLAARLDPYRNRPVHVDLLRQMTAEAQGFLANNSIPSFTTRASIQTALGGDAPAPIGGDVDLSNTAGEALYNIRSWLDQSIPSPEGRPPEGSGLGRGDLLGLLNGAEPALVIVQSDNDDELRKFTSYAVGTLFGDRRRSGRSSPQTLFVYDEADEFIPGQSSSGTTYATSRAAAATLARRGRKFGMGIGIATQRVAYLDTSILAQPHTYFVSKLPREYDRKTMAEAFGITEDMMRRTLRFRVGDWLLVSFDSTGLVNVPIPVHVPNANDRIRSHFAEAHGT